MSRCVSGIRTCQQVGQRSTQIENRKSNYYLPDCELLTSLRMNSTERKNIYSLPINQFNTIDEVTNIVKKPCNIFHSNVDGYECHSDGLQEILSKSSINLCLSETSQQSDHIFPKNGTVTKMLLTSPSPYVN